MFILKTIKENKNKRTFTQNIQTKKTLQFHKQSKNNTEKRLKKWFSNFYTSKRSRKKKNFQSKETYLNSNFKKTLLCLFKC